MDIQEEKLLLIEQLLRVSDGKLIEEVRELLNNNNNPIIGYDAHGQAIPYKDFIKKIEQAENEYVGGNFQTIQELEKESDNW